MMRQRRRGIVPPRGAADEAIRRLLSLIRPGEAADIYNHDTKWFFRDGHTPSTTAEGYGWNLVAIAATLLWILVRAAEMAKSSLHRGNGSSGNYATNLGFFSASRSSPSPRPGAGGAPDDSIPMYLFPPVDVVVCAVHSGALLDRLRCRRGEMGCRKSPGIYRP